MGSTDPNGTPFHPCVSAEGRSKLNFSTKGSISSGSSDLQKRHLRAPTQKRKFRHHWQPSDPREQYNGQEQAHLDHYDISMKSRGSEKPREQQYQPMKYSIYCLEGKQCSRLPPATASSDCPVLYFLATMDMNHQ